MRNKNPTSERNNRVDQHQRKVRTLSGFKIEQETPHAKNANPMTCLPYTHLREHFMIDFGKHVQIHFVLLEEVHVEVRRRLTESGSQEEIFPRIDADGGG